MFSERITGEKSGVKKQNNVKSAWSGFSMPAQPQYSLGVHTRTTFTRTLMENISKKSEKVENLEISTKSQKVDLEPSTAFTGRQSDRKATLHAQSIQE